MWEAFAVQKLLSFLVQKLLSFFQQQKKKISVFGY